MRDILLACALITAGQVLLAANISSVVPRSCVPGKTTRVTLHGSDFDETLRAVASSPQIEVQIQHVEATQAQLEVTLPDNASLGPFGLALATSDGPLASQVMLIDDLQPVADNGQNHGLASAQAVASLCVVEGVCDSAASDFYRIVVAQGQHIAFEIHTQQLLSTMDPVVRLLDAAGQPLHTADEDAVGPDCRFSYQFDAAGDYFIEVHDSRHAAAGSVYHLRIGDFPILSHCQPLALRRGTTAQVGFAGQDAALIAPQTVQAPATGSATSMWVAARFDGGHSSAWLPLLLSDTEQFIEPDASVGASTVGQPLSIPIAISGRLTQPKEVDAYWLRAAKDDSIRVQARTRSVGCPTLLNMQLFDAAGKKLAETKIGEDDEWSFETTLPADGLYRLDVSDLLRRGGPDYGYWLEVVPKAAFHIAFKADAAVPEQAAIEPGSGAFAIDLQIARHGYEGAIDLSLVDPSMGLRIVNPRIPAGAKEARVYLAANGEWSADQLKWVRLQANAVDDPQQTRGVRSQELQRIKRPQMLSPAQWLDGNLMLSGVAASEAPFAFDTTSPVRFARPVLEHTATLTLQRIQPEFKAGVTLLADALPAGWSLESTADKDVYATKFKRADAATTPEVLSLQAFAEANGRARIEAFELPIEWFDPLRATLEAPATVVRGGRATLQVAFQRDGSEPQPVVLKPIQLPVGVTGPESVTATAEQTHVSFEVQLAADAPLAAVNPLAMSATSTFSGHQFTIPTNSVELNIVDSPQQLLVQPTDISFQDTHDRRQLVITGIDAGGAPRDWTRLARIRSANPAIASVDAGVVFPQQAGATEIEVEVGALRQTIPVVVSNAADPRPIRFESEVLVALSKQGCNSGACHGSPSGKAGFRLSLRAFDKQLDELTLIREDFGRRVNTLQPEQSLLLLKPLMRVPHGGGKKLHEADPAFQILREWIAQGALADPPETPRVVRLEVFPSEKRVLDVAAGGQQIAVMAHFADGSTRDVTHLVAYESSDGSVATVDVQGLITPHARGELAILVRYLEHIESLPLMFVQPRDGFEWSAPPSNNYIDDLVHVKLRQLQYLPAETCSDAEFLRRVSFDLIGILPTVEQTKAFLADTRSDKRSRWVDGLLQRDEYAKFWALKWGDLLRMTSKLVGDEGVHKYHRWLETSLRENMPYDEFARQLLTGSGSTLANPPANFYRTASDMNECVETISQVFLGARLQCAKCHNHPFERWTQDNYYGLGAFFNRVERRKTQRPGEMFIFTKFSGDVTQPRTGEVMQPWLPQTGSVSAAEDEDRRQRFAQWLIEPSNPYFARIEANRIWSQLFARGIVDPIDDFRDSNPPSNAPLLDALAADFVEHGFDRKHLLRTITSSRTYQASYQTNEFNREDLAYFSHQEPRLLSAEQLLDAINHTLGLEQNFAGLPIGTRATQLPAPDLAKVDFLKVFGQPERSTVCACERADDSNLGMAIELFNGPTVHEKLRDPKNRFRLALDAKHSTQEAIVELYLASVCRPPSPTELEVALEHCRQAADVTAGLEDVCWALFNTDEFLFQH